MPSTSIYLLSHRFCKKFLEWFSDVCAQSLEIKYNIIINNFRGHSFQLTCTLWRKAFCYPLKFFIAHEQFTPSPHYSVQNVSPQIQTAPLYNWISTPSMFSSPKLPEVELSIQNSKICIYSFTSFDNSFFSLIVEIADENTS